MSKRFTAALLAAGLFTVLGMSTTAYAGGVHPKPPKCVPASTPGCS
jgi:hypothetical protein